MDDLISGKKAFEAELKLFIKEVNGQNCLSMFNPLLDIIKKYKYCFDDADEVQILLANFICDNDLDPYQEDVIEEMGLILSPMGKKYIKWENL